MKKINFVQQVLPHILAVLAFLIVTIIFFNPVFFENKGLEQHDIQMWDGSSKALRDYRDQTGEEGLWAPSMFSGMPAYLINVEWSYGPVMFFKKVLTLGLPHPIANIFAAFICYYILLLTFKVRPYIAIAGAIAFGLSSNMIIGLGAGHNGRIGAIAFMPLVMAGIHLAFSKKKILGFGVTTLGLALHLRENHLQITYYLLIVVAIYGLVKLIEAIQQKILLEFAKTIGILIPAVVIAGGTFFGPLWGITEYTKYSTRGPSELVSEESAEHAALSKDYAFDHSNGIWEPMVMLIPNFYGGATVNFLVQDESSNVYKALVQSGDQQTANQLASYTSAYWGPQAGTAPYYAGAIICFLFIVGIVYAEKKYMWWLVATSALGIMLTWGNNFSSFNYFLFDYLPGYNKFRSATFALVIPLFAMPLLGLLGLENLLKEGWKNDTLKKLAIPFALTAGLCLILAMVGGFGSFLREGEQQLPPWFTNALRADRMSLLRSDAWRSFWFIAVFAVVVYARLRNWIKDPVFAIIAFVFITFDLSFVDKRYFTKEKFQSKRLTTAMTPTEADKEIMLDKGYYRVYPHPQQAWAEAHTAYFHNSIGGYHGAKLRRYQDLIDSCLFKQTQALFQNLQQGSTDFSSYGTINMLNVKYMALGAEKNSIIPNPDANGPAWFVKEVQNVNSPAEELKALCEINTRDVAVVDASKFQVPKSVYDSASTITILDHFPNRLKYETNSQTGGLAVFSEIYYPKGWVATIDGNKAPILRADYVLRALMVPGGKHTVEFRFEPAAYRIGNKVTLIASWLMLVVVLGCIGLEVKKSQEQINQP